MHPAHLFSTNRHEYLNKEYIFLMVVNVALEVSKNYFLIFIFSNVITRFISKLTQFVQSLYVFLIVRKFTGITVFIFPNWNCVPTK